MTLVESLLPCDFTEQLEEATFALAAEGPVYRHGLKALVIAFAHHPIVEIAPRGVLADRCQEIVRRLVEVEMIVLVEQNGHWAIAFHLPRLPDHLSDAGWIFYAVAVQQKKIRCAYHIGTRDGIAAITGTHEQTPTALRRSPCRALDEFVHSLGLEDGVIV